MPLTEETCQLVKKKKKKMIVASIPKNTFLRHKEHLKIIKKGEYHKRKMVAREDTPISQQTDGTTHQHKSEKCK